MKGLYDPVDVDRPRLQQSGALNSRRHGMKKVLLPLALACATAFAHAQGFPTPTPITEIQPAPASIGADVPATYFGTAPSTVQKELIGPFQLLKAGKLDLEAGTITLPLYKGKMTSGESVRSEEVV